MILFSFRFVVSSLVDQTASLVDPDALVGWQSVEQVIIPVSAPLSCPICLCEPTVPKVTRCGHVFCHSCVLHYLALGEEPYRKCALCQDAIYAKDLKSVYTIKIRDYSNRRKDESTTAGTSESAKSDLLVFRLMQRSTGSCTVLPRPQYSKWAMTSHPKLDNGNSHLMTYAKILIADPAYIIYHIIDHEVAELMQALEDAKRFSDPELPYIEMALEQVRAREKQLHLTSPGLKPAANSSPRPRPSLTPSSLPVEEMTLLPPPAMMDKEQSASSELDYLSDEESGKSQQTSAEASPKIRIEASPNMGPKDDMYYFYQSADGQHLYIHPLDIKMLKTAYGNYCDFPDEICVSASVIVETTLTDDVRKRYKYLSHLPLSCDLAFVEIDWKRPAVCRKRVTASKTTSPIMSPRLFGRDPLHEEQYTTEQLLPDSEIAKWNQDLAARRKRHVKKHKKEEKEERRRHNSSSFSETTANTLQVPDHRAHRRPEEASLNFNDEASWAPLVSSAAKSPVSPRPVESRSYAEKARQLTYNEQFPPPLSPVDEPLASAQNGATPPTPVKKSPSGSFAAILHGTTADLEVGGTGEPSTMSAKKKGKKKQVVMLLSSAGQRGSRP